MATGEDVGPRIEQCGWIYGGHCDRIECFRDDEIVAGRCGSGSNHDCPNDGSHGILCCELVAFEE